MKRSIGRANHNRKTVHGDAISSQYTGILRTEILVEYNKIDNIAQLDRLRNFRTPHLELAARGLEKAINDNLPQGTYEVSGKAGRDGPVALIPYRR